MTLQRTLASCCLVCWEWNRTFTPHLYQSIVFADDFSNSVHIISQLRRTLWHVQPKYTHIIKKITILTSEAAKACTWLSVLSKLPNLRELRINGFDHSQFHPKLAQHLRALSARCAIKLNPGVTDVLVPRNSISRWFRFLRQAQPQACVLRIEQDARGAIGKQCLVIHYQKTYEVDYYKDFEASYSKVYYVGNCRVTILGQLYNTSDVDYFNTLLSQTRIHPVKISLTLRKLTSILPSEYIIFQHLQRPQIIMKTFRRNKSSRVYSTPFIVHRPGTLTFRGSTRIRDPMVRDALQNTDIPVAQNPVNRLPVCIRKLPRDRGYAIGSQSSASRIEGLLG